MSTLCPFLKVPWVGLQSVITAFLSHTLSFFLSFETTCITSVGDKTIVLHKICSSLNTYNQRQKSLVFVGFVICYIHCVTCSVRKLNWHVFFFILNTDHYILFAAKTYILLLILHGLNKPTRIPPILALF